ncbi:MAG TPA: carboxypeptidase-like regulatory domain-containing protein [Pyrinomonadaceae bacterium]|nr:carboxypeptidase-like regulatory domain-containing protein [Pyrinomonadaceae bacterium]
MRKLYWLASVLLVASAAGGAWAPSALAGGGGERRTSLGTISGTVLDSRGNPVSGALVKILRDGLNEVVKETRSNPDGTFTTRVTPGRYLVRALAEGFTPATFSSAQVAPATELVYRFSLLPAGEGYTTPERRPDRNDPKFRIRASHSRRSVFNAGEGDSDPIREALERLEAEEAAAADGGFETPAAEEERRTGKPRTQGYLETFVASSLAPGAGTYAGLNFAIKTPVTRDFEMIFAGQAGEFERMEATARLRAGDRHRLSATLGGARLPTAAARGGSLKKALGLAPAERLGQMSVRAVDEWVVRDGIVLVVGLDYSRFVGAGDADSFSPRLGFAFEANPRTRLHASYAAGDAPQTRADGVNFEDTPVVFKEAEGQAVALIDGRAVMERSRRLEFGVERILDESSSVEATAFFDTVSGRGVGLLSTPLEAFDVSGGAALLDIANQQGGARGLRVVYTRRVSQHLRASAGYAFGRGQRLSPEAFAAGPDRLFDNAFFQTVAAQLDASVLEGTNVRTVLRFSPGAAVFAIDPFAGRLAVYDPSLSILVTQDLPSFGLPVRAQATVDARNLLDTLTGVDGEDGSVTLGTLRRTVRGGISLRF